VQELSKDLLKWKKSLAVEARPLKISPGFYDGEGHGPQPFIVFQ
jgi:hypothetical protein